MNRRKSGVTESRVKAGITSKVPHSGAEQPIHYGLEQTRIET